jgi:HlyD family secretion protein
MTTQTVSKPRKPTKRRSRALWWLLLIPLAGVGYFFWNKAQTTAAAASAVTIETAQPFRGDFKLSVSGPGTLQAGRSLDLRPQVNGTILTLPKVGTRVKQGQLLATLDPTSLERAVQNAQLALQKAQSQLQSTQVSQQSNKQSQNQSLDSAKSGLANAQRDLENAQNNLNNQQRIFNAGGISSQQLSDAQNILEKAKTSRSSAQIQLSTTQNSQGLKVDSDVQDLRNQTLAVDSAKLQLQTAQSDLSSSKIYAPFTGVVSSLTGQVGGSASSGQALLTLIDDSSLELPVQVDETEIAKVAVGQKTNITLDAVKGTFVGKVIRVSPAARIDQNIAIFDVAVGLPNPDGVLKAGMTAEGEIISQELLNVIQVPKRAVETVRTRSYVHVLQKDGKTDELTLVRTSESDASNIVVTDGLQGNETLVLPTKAVVATTTTTGLPRGASPLGIPLGGGGR